MPEFEPHSRNEALLNAIAENTGGGDGTIDITPVTRNEYLLKQIMLNTAGGSSGGGKTLAQMGFITNASTINVMSGTAPDYRISISSGYGQDYVPEAGSLLIVRAPSSGIAANATLKFAVGSNKYTQSWPINLAGGPIVDGYVNANEIVLLSFNGKRFFVASVVRDPVTVPTKLSDLENDLDLSGIKIIDATAMATSLHGLLSLVKSGITGASGQKTVLFTSNSFSQLVLAVFNAFSSDKLPVFFLGIGFYLPVVDTGNDGNDNVWFTVRMQETEMVGTTVTGYTHQITISMGGVVIQTTKTAIEVQPLPSA